jgi:hypothetical protein
LLISQLPRECTTTSGIQTTISKKRKLPTWLKAFLFLGALTIGAMLVQGYHPGVEDDFVYLSAIKHDLNPGLYPHDSDFFRLQLQATVFDKVIADSVKLTHIPLAWALLAWQTAGIFLLLLGCFEIAKRCFPDAAARWTAVALVAALLTLPVAGTALFIVDQHLHPRTLATSFVLFAIVSVLDRRKVRAGFWTILAMFFHPLMGAFGASYCVFLAWSAKRNVRPVPPLQEDEERQETSVALAGCGNQFSLTAPLGIAAFIPLGWIFEQPTAAWREAAATRSYYFLSRQQWYEWVGLFAPFLILWWFSRIEIYLDRVSPFVTARRALASSLIWYGLFQFAVTIAIMLPPQLERFRTFQPLRYLHLLYLLMFLLAGGLMSKFVLKGKPWRYALLFVPLSLGMFLAQRQEFPASSHIEFPGQQTSNPWLQAFAWIRQNTPEDAYFALGPRYMEQPSEDVHSFRAIAERSQLADLSKDPSVSTQVPRLAVRWQKEFHAQDGWEHFEKKDFERLKRDFGVGWVVLNRQVSGMECPYATNQKVPVRVCRIT